MKLDIELTEQSLNEAIRLIENYKNDFMGKVHVTVDHAAKVVEDNARVELQKHIWSGETISSLHTEKKDTAATSTRTVKVGGAAIWLEFGTGVVANKVSVGEYVHPLGKELGMVGIGQYGRGLGGSPNGWYFDSDSEWVTDQFGSTYNVYESHHTFGIPATMFMYNSALAARRDFIHYAKGVFWTK